MTKSEVIQRLHKMVDQLETVPDEWFAEGIYPMHKITFARKDSDDDRITLVVGVEEWRES